MLPGEDSEQPYDFGADWDAVEQHLGPKSEANRLKSDVAGVPGGLTQPPQQGRRSGFAIVLESFSGTGHALAAQQYRQRLESLVPTISSGVRLSEVASGTLVVYGEYTGWGDARSREDLKKLRDLTVNNQRIFPTAMITELKPPRDLASIGEDELVWLRVKYPDIRMLYTLEIAIWSDFDSGKLSAEERRTKAVRYARSLRQRGVPAFYHHDENRSMSMVTVGVFDHTAVDAASGLKSPQVERFLVEFPQRMVNGEPMLNLYDANDPDKGGRPQPPRLVEVPKP